MDFNATFLIAAISFILFVIIMNKIFYRPIEKIVNEREAFIDANLDETKKNNNNTKKLIDEYDEKINDANYKSKSLMEETSNNAKLKKAELILTAQKKASENIHKNQTALNQAFSQAKSELNVNDLADAVVLKLLESSNVKGGEK